MCSVGANAGSLVSGRLTGPTLSMNVPGTGAFGFLLTGEGVRCRTGDGEGPLFWPLTGEWVLR